MRALGVLTNLAALCLSGCEIHVPDLHHFSSLTALRTLHVGGCRLPAEGTAALLGGLPTRMTALDLQGNYLSESVVTALGTQLGCICYPWEQCYLCQEHCTVGIVALCYNTRLFADIGFADIRQQRKPQQ